MTDRPTPYPPVALVGPTAAGKSTLALAAALSSQLDVGSGGAVEIVAVDAMQVYRGMDIGTAKPDAGEQGLVAHHGIDLFDPWEDGTVADYARHADAAIAAIAGRHHRALLVGGTGLYLRALVDRLEPPGQWPAIRARLEAEATDHGAVAVLHARLAVRDPIAAARMEPTNTRRVVRALEVCEGSGRAFSSFGPGLDAYLPTDIVQIGLKWERPVLAARIEQRVHQMMAAGLLAEVERLVAAPGGLSRTARQALGYTELLEHLDGRWSLDEAVAATVLRTRQFAVRQERWFRRDPRLRWVFIHHDPLEALPVLIESLSA